jgi:N-acetyl-anhydromuramyl-L-alanine amidase AmpD
MSSIKQKIFIFIFFFAVGGVAGFLYFKNSSEKSKIIVQNETAENDTRGLTSTSPDDTSRSDPDEASNFKGSTSESSENTPRLNLDGAAKKVNIADNLVSWGYQESSPPRRRKIDTVIIHSTYNALGGDQYSLAKILDIYKSYGVSPHYIIDRGGKIYRLVADENIAYHAGESKMPDGRTGVNNFSIGIEMINNKTDNFTSAQYASLNDLLRYLHSKYAIEYVLGHSQIAPGRKDDPWNIVWSKVVK